MKNKYQPCPYCGKKSCYIIYSFMGERNGDYVRCHSCKRAWHTSWAHLTKRAADCLSASSCGIGLQANLFGWRGVLLASATANASRWADPCIIWQRLIMKNDILEAIAKNSAFGTDEVYRVYEIFKSYDLLVLACEFAAAHCYSNLETACIFVKSAQRTLACGRATPSAKSKSRRNTPAAKA